ncbi:MAG TPA: hypothetical protein VII47_07710 [Actinomycetota bacterium]|jgi:hypothetical protein
MTPEAQAAQSSRTTGGLQGTGQVPAAAGVEIGQQVRVAGKRGCYRVVGFRPGGVQLMDDDQKWHVVRPEAVRLLPSSPAARAGHARPAAG